MFLADPEGKIWDSDELNHYLDEALKQYCIDSGSFSSSFDFYPDPSGTYNYPENYASFMIGWDQNGNEITPTTAKNLYKFTCRNANRRGDARYIYDDLDSYGSFSLHPLPEQHQKNITVTPEYGEILDFDHGVFDNGDYGTTLSVISFVYAGTICYRKIGRYEDIKDYMAVISYALNLAYSNDSELSNSDNADFWKTMYKKRVATFSRLVCNSSGKKMVSNFY